MAERYSKLFSLPENLYAQGSPVVIAAGALLKDNVTDNMLAQLKIQNISDKPIKAVKVAITPLDSVGRPLGGEIEYQYLDLSAKRDDFFGVKTPVALPDAITRSYTVRVVEVAFGDNSLWNEAGAPWETLPKQRTLASALGDAGIAEQYKKDVGNNWSDREPAEYKDLWLCACGAINRSGEPCHKCHKTFAELTDFDIEKLKENFKSRIEAEARYQHIQKQKKRRRFVLAGTLTAVLIIILSLFFINTESVYLIESKYVSVASQTTNYKYNSHGYIVERKVETDGEISLFTSVYEYNEDDVIQYEYNENDELCYKYIYNDGQLISWLYYDDSMDQLSEMVSYKYDYSGNLIAENWVLFGIAYEYKYDYNGRKTTGKIIYDDGSSWNMKYECEYDKFGNLISEKEYFDGEYYSSLIQTSQYEYIKKRVWKER